MLAETNSPVEARAPGATRVGLMSTTGTRASGVYRGHLQGTIVEVAEGSQGGLHEAIYNPEWGVKATAPVTSRAREAFEEYASELVDEGAEAGQHCS